MRKPFIASATAISAVGLLLFGLNASATLGYVNVNSASPTSPYTSWAFAATNIQDAMDVAADSDEIVVTNGIYATGGRAVYGTMTNRVAIDKALTVRSVNGPLVTLIQGQAAPGTANGDGAIRCVYVGTNALLSGFTLTNGHTRAVGDYYKERGGGGAWCETSGVVTYCTLSGNSASQDGGGAFSGKLTACTFSGNSAGRGGGTSVGTLTNCILSGNSSDQGGGALDGTFNNCIFSGNSANSDGGGAYWGTLENCILWGNSAYQGGGAAAATLNNCTLGGNLATGAYASGGGAKDAMLNNCIVYFNSAPNYPNYYSSTFNYSCTTPLPSGPGNIEANPAFVDTNGWSNLHLQSNSLCIDAGNNAYAPGSTDLDGNPRIVGGMVDMGAYEFQSSTGTRYVNLSNPTPTPPYTTWATAAINIQDAVDAAVAGDQIMVTNGLYATGGRAVYGAMTNRVGIDKAVTVRSVNGPLVTLIQGVAAPGTTNGDGAIRCVYLPGIDADTP